MQVLHHLSDVVGRFAFGYAHLVAHLEVFLHSLKKLGKYGVLPVKETEQWIFQGLAISL